MQFLDAVLVLALTVTCLKSSFKNCSFVLFGLNFV